GAARAAQRLSEDGAGPRDRYGDGRGRGEVGDMDPKILRYYNRELQHVREMGAEFAREYPKIAGRLGLEGIEVADPYVERLLEGFAYLSARVQLKVDAEFPAFTQHLLQ